MKKLHYKSTITSLLFAGGLLLSLPVAMAADVTGSVNYNGERPRPRKVRLIGDQVCKDLHTVDGELRAPRREGLIVSKDLKIRNVFVYVKEVEGKFSPPEEAVLLNQEGCTYVPHVLGMVKGQDLKILNSDPTMHNVHSFAKLNRAFNRGQLENAPPIEVTMRRTEVGIKVSCDVHPWMTSFVHVVDHPFFAVTGKNGAFTIKDLPPGNYTLVAIHERLGTQEQAITVGEAGLADVQVTFDPEGGVTRDKVRYG